MLSPAAIWHQPGNNRFSGTHTGIAAVGGLLGQMTEVSKRSFAIAAANRFMANGDLVAVEIEFSGERDGVKLSRAGIDLLRFSEGRIVVMWLFSSDPAEEDSFWVR